MVQYGATIPIIILSEMTTSKMKISTAEWLALAIFIVSLLKSFWDLRISPALYKKRIKNKSGEALTAEVRKKRARDAKATQLAFVFLAILSATVLLIGFYSKDITSDDLAALSRRLEALEVKRGQQ